MDETAHAHPDEGTPTSGPATPGGRLPLEVVIPLRWDGPDEDAHARDLHDLTRHLAWLCQLADVTVVDGSGPDRFTQHASTWAGFAPALRHRAPEDRPALNRKVVGAMTGIRMARHPRVVLADDDVRHDSESLHLLHDLLADADLVRPQNIFATWPWHARWDGSRSLLNRAVAQDWPGTFGVRRDTVLAVGGWDADVMFENLELVRTLRVAGARIVDAPDVLVPRRPPTSAHFWSQRVRQAYDDLAQPWRLAWALSVLPALALALRRRPVTVPLTAAALVAVAHAGRARGDVAPAVPADVPLWAPVWVLERGVCSWLAVGQRLRGGVPYRGQRIAVAAHSTRTLRRSVTRDPQSFVPTASVTASGLRPSTRSRTTSQSVPGYASGWAAGSTTPCEDGA